ncbi:AAA family ATPase [Actinoplanes sp. NPDC051633]|uniref:AAA family ATPase n=1 Tax=Actinoplanes sp. NPDC051633 TaxID=3155670 RepID=UPI003435D6B2
MARDVVMVNGLPGAGKSSLAPRLANGLGAAYLSKDRIKEALADAVVTELPALGAVAMETIWMLAAQIGGTVVVDSWWFRPRDLDHARNGLATSGATGVVEVWCDVPAEVARRRFVARNRHGLYRDDDHSTADWPIWAAEAEPLAIGQVIRVDARNPIDIPALTGRVRAALWS